MAIHRIKPAAVAKLIESPGKHCDGGGLYLQVAAPGQASWVWRHREKWKSLGPANLYSLTEAREKAHALRKAAHEGTDPFQVLGQGRVPGRTFGEALEEYLAIKAPTWAASNRERGLRRHHFLFGHIPDFVALPIKAIDQPAKNRALSTFEAGSKNHRDIGFYIEAVLRYAIEGKLRLKKAGGDVEHHAAMPWRDVPAFYKRLAELGTVDARALQWTILTACRTDEVIGAKHKSPATWGEITEEDGLPVWDIPAERMKGGKRHRVPLSAEALALLGPRKADKAPLFEVSSANGLLNTLKRTDGGNGFTVHGFRTSFTEYVAHETNCSEELADRCIAHERRTKVRRAYQRSDQLEKRRPIMQGWSDYLTK